MIWNLPLNEDDVETGGSNSIPLGEHEIRILSISEKESKVKRTPYIEIEFTGIHPETNQPFSINDRFYLTDGAQFKIKGFLKIMGKPFQGNVEFDDNELIGKSIKVMIGEQASNNRYKEIKYYIDPNANQTKQLDMFDNQSSDETDNKDNGVDIPF